jgi:predicted metal-dependent peptidase
MSSDLTARLKKARLDLVLDVPFFGTLAFKLKTEIDASKETAATDGVSIRINPDFAAKLTQPQLAGLLVEEIGHCAMGHLWRATGRDPGLWNKACDQVLWETIAGLQNATDGRISLPPTARVDPQYSGLAAEEVYHRMRQNSGSDPSSGGDDYQSPGGMDAPAKPDDKSGDGESDEEGEGKGEGECEGQGEGEGKGQTEPADNLEQEWQAAVAQAATVERQKSQGNLPAWMKRLVEELIEPRVPWYEYIREFCHRLAREDYSFRRVNRRHLARGFVLPSLHSERLGPIVGAFDTSGSIFGHPPLVQALLSELQGVLDICRPETLHLISCDTRIHQHIEFVPGDTLLGFEPQGGGGTDFRPIFQAADALPEPPACLIFLTDLYGTFPDHAPDYPVLWANYGDPANKAPFGTTIFVPIDT